MFTGIYTCMQTHAYLYTEICIYNMQVHTHTCIHIHEHTHLCSLTHISGPSQETDHISSEQGKFHQAYNYKGAREPYPGQNVDLLLVPSVLVARRAGHRTHSPSLYPSTKHTDNRHYVYIFTYDNNSSIK